MIQQVINNFYGWFGQKVSLCKSMVYVSSNVKSDLAKAISQNLGMLLTNNLEKYLGMSTIHVRITHNTFKFIFDKVYSRLAGWKAKYLSLAGQATLIKSVTYSILVYAMQTSKLPTSICDAIDKCNMGFLWSDTKQKRRILLVNWKEVCKPKDNRGLDKRSMRQANIALLFKLEWHLLNSRDSLWANLVKGKYFGDKNGMEVFLIDMGHFIYGMVLCMVLIC